MTNAEHIRQMTDDELAEFLCDDIDTDCDYCIAKDYCRVGSNGFKKWIRMEVE